MSTLEVNTIDSVSGTSNLTIGSSNSSQITLKSGATLTNFPANTPAFVSNKFLIKIKPYLLAHIQK